MNHDEHELDRAWADALIDEPRPARAAPTAPRGAPARTGRTWAIAVCVLSLLLGTPIAVQAAGEGDPVEGGARNPEPDQTLALQRETEIIADTPRDSYGTRQSNKGAGGGAIYGCRSALDIKDIGDPAVSTPCIRANNLNTGKAFDFQVGKGNLGGVIQKTNNIREFFPDAAPFFTNMGGVALGLNADRVDNMNASEIIAKAREGMTGPSGDDTTGGGATPAAGCPAGTVAAGGGCLESAPRAAADYADASRACAQEGRRLAPANVLLGAASSEGIDLGGGEVSADVTTTLPIDLNGPLAPLIDAVNDLLGPLGPLAELDPATVTGAYTRVSDAGSLAASNLSEPAPYRCFA